MTAGWRPRKRAHLDQRDLPDGCAVLDPRAEAAHVLNASAAYLLSLCDGERAIGELVAAFADIAPTLDEAELHRDVRRGLEELVVKGLVEAPAADTHD